MPSPRISAMKWLLASGWKRLRNPMPPSRPLSTCRARLLTAGDVDGGAGREAGVGGADEAEPPGPVLRGGHPPERRPADRGGLGVGRAAIPVRADALGQGEARGDGVDGDAVGAELEGQLAGERDDAALGGGVRA